MTIVNVTDATLKGTVTGPTFSGNVDGAKFSGSLTYTDTTTPPPEQTNSVSLFTTQTPVLPNASDGASVTYELGVKFKSSVAGSITALRFWKGDKETGTHTGNIWSATGSKLASVTFTGETASGWQTQKLATPLNITANTTYIASVGTSNSFFATSENALTTSVSNPPLSTIVGNNGVYGPRGACPSQTSRSNNYFRDVVFVGGSTQPPVTTGVTLQAIDGETMTSPTTMSSNYHARDGYTYPASTSYNAGKPLWYAGSWDNPKFFLLGSFFGLYEDATGDMAKFQALQLNTSVAVTGGSNMTNVANAGVWSIGSPVANTSTAGMELDEPSSTADFTAFFNTPNATQDGRLMHVNGTHTAIEYGDIGGTKMNVLLAANHFTTPNGSKKSIGWFSIDLYWFAISTITQTTDPGNLFSGVNGQINLIFGLPTSPTTDQTGRGSHYGQMIDVMRSWGNGSNGGSLSDIPNQTSLAPSRCPLFAYLENYDGKLTEKGRHQITPPQLNWAAWSQLIHGARAIVYFAFVNDHGGGQFSQTVQSGQSISVYTQAVATNTLISQLAPVLNSPFAKGFLTTVTPHGYLFPVYEANWLNGGIEACVHQYQGGNVTNNGLALVNGFYIFATTRAGEASGPISATFTVASGSTANVVGENRSIPISGGKFTDTFAKASTVHIYQIS